MRGGCTPRASPVMHVHAVEHLPRPADRAAEGLTGVAAGPELTVVIELLRRVHGGASLVDADGLNTAGGHVCAAQR